VGRDNKAVQLHPTDFALLSVDPEQLPQLLKLLQHVPGFRDVHPDRRIQGVSNWQPEGPLAAAFSDAPLQQQQQQTHPALRQSPGALKLVQEAVAAMPSKQLLADAPVDGSSQQGDPGSSSSQQAAQQQQQGQQQQQQPQPPAEQAGVQPPTAGDAVDEDGDSIWSVGKPPGRMSTAHTIGLDPKSKADREAGYNKDELRRKSSRRRGLLSWASGLWSSSSSSSSSGRSSGRLLQQADTRVTHLLEAPVLWKQGFSGKGIKVGVRESVWVRGRGGGGVTDVKACGAAG
jgi:hypothetical protein